MENQYKYSVSDLCELFNINPNSFPSLAKRLELNLHSKMQKNEYKAKKRYYDQTAFNLLVDYFKKRNKKFYDKDSLLLNYINKIKDLENKCDYLKIFKIEEENEVLKKEKNNIEKELNKIKETLEISIFETQRIKNILNERLVEIKNLKKELYKKENEIKKLKNQNIVDFLKNKKKGK